MKINVPRDLPVPKAKVTRSARPLKYSYLCFTTDEHYVLYDAHVPTVDVPRIRHDAKRLNPRVRHVWAFPKSATRSRVILAIEAL